jgi:hypothetical protein
VVANWTTGKPDTRADAKPEASPAASVSRAPAPGPARHVAATPSTADIDACNQYARSGAGDKATEVVKDALIGGAVGAGVGAAGGRLEVPGEEHARQGKGHGQRQQKGLTRGRVVLEAVIQMPVLHQLVEPAVFNVPSGVAPPDHGEGPGPRGRQGGQPAPLVLLALVLPLPRHAPPLAGRSEDNMNGPPAAVAPPLVPVTAT